MVAWRRFRLVAIVGLLLVVVLLSGCYFNIFQTARTVGAGKVAVSLGSGVVSMTIQQQSSLLFTPQARLTIGLSDSVDLGVQSGLVIGSSGEPGFLGVLGDVKLALAQDPNVGALALASVEGTAPGSSDGV